MGYSDETWYVGSGGHKYYPTGLPSLTLHIQYLIAYLFGLANKERQISRVLFELQ